MYTEKGRGPTEPCPGALQCLDTGEVRRNEHEKEQPVR